MSVYIGCGVFLEENLVIVVGGVLFVLEVVLIDFVEGYGRGIGGDMIVDVNIGMLCVMYGNGGILV